MEDKFIWEETKTGDIIIKQRRVDGKYYKVAILDDETIPDFTLVWAQIQSHVHSKIKKQLEKLNKLNDAMFPGMNGSPAPTETPTTSQPTIEQDIVHKRQNVPTVKFVESKGDVSCGSCEKIIAAKTKLFLCTVCGQPTHENHGEDGVCQSCLNKA